MGNMLKGVKAGDKVVYGNSKLNRKCAKEYGIVVGKIYTVKADPVGDLYVQETVNDFKCYAGLWSGWSSIGKPTKIVD